MKYISHVTAIAFTIIMVGCSDGSDTTKTQAQHLLERFGELQEYFTEEGMQSLLDYQDTGNPVTLIQLMSVADDDSFKSYQEQAAALWESVGASERFQSESFEQMIGERLLNQTQVIEFPNVMVLLSAIDTPAFTDLMNALAAASDDHAWVIGEQLSLPFEPSGSYFDPSLQNLQRSDPLPMLLAGAGANDEGDLNNNVEAVIDMLISDAPSPFWMVNLIDWYDLANFADGRETDLTGREADQIYGDFILPLLTRFNSFPAIAMPIAATLTADEVEWEQAAIVRYASRDAFINAFVTNPQTQEFLEYKEAGVENTLVFATEVPGTVIAAPETGPLYNFRYCEVLLVFPGEATGLRADVYNSMPLSTCPQEQWDALDAEQIRADYDAIAAALNGIRFWVLDSIEAQLPPGEPVLENFGGIDMRLAASVDIAASATLGEPVAYQINRVSRDTVFHYVAGRQVYELENPDGTRYRMQSFTQGTDPNQQLVDLQRLGSRLELPAGWSFHVTLLEEHSPVRTVDGIAEVITDELGNTYQRVQ